MQRSNISVLDFDDFTGQAHWFDAPVETYAIAGLARAGSTIGFSADHSTDKLSAASQLALSFATGTPFAGRDVLKCGVTVLCSKSTAKELLPYLEFEAERRKVMPADLPVIVATVTGRTFNEPARLARVLERASEKLSAHKGVEHRAIIIPSITLFQNNDEPEDDSAARVLHAVRDVTFDSQPTIVGFDYSRYVNGGFEASKFNTRFCNAHFTMESIGYYISRMTAHPKRKSRGTPLVAYYVTPPLKRAVKGAKIAPLWRMDMKDIVQGEPHARFAISYSEWANLRKIEPADAIAFMKRERKMAQAYLKLHSTR